MSYGLQTMDASGVVRVAPSSTAGLFVEVRTVAAGASETVTYPQVPAGSLHVIQSINGTHTWSVSANGSGQAQLVVTATPSDGSTEYASTFLVMAKQTTEPSYGFMFTNDQGERTVSSVFPVPVYIGKATINTTPQFGFTGPGGYQVCYHSMTFPGLGSTNRLLFLSLPDNTDDTWYGTVSLRPSTSKNPGYQKPGAAVPEATIIIATKVANYKLPEVLVFTLDSYPTSAEPWGIQLLDDQGRTTYHSALETIIYTKLRNDIAFSTTRDGVLSFSVPELTNGAIAMSSYSQRTATQVSGSLHEFDVDYGFVRKNGTTLETKLIWDSNYQASLAGVTTGVRQIGRPTNLTLAVIARATFGGVTTLPTIQKPSPPGGLVSFTGTEAIAPGFAAFSLQSVGTWSASNAEGSSQDGSWYSPNASGIGANYWVRVTRTGGTSTGFSGTLNAWLQLNVNRNWTYSTNTSTARSGTYRFEFATDAAGTNIVMTCDNVFIMADGIF